MSRFDERHTVDFLLLDRTTHVQKTILTHRAEDCSGGGCAFHGPSDHALKDAPTVWKMDGPFEEGRLFRQCEHGTIHPDRDDVNFRRRTFPFYRPLHNCDGCC